MYSFRHLLFGKRAIYLCVQRWSWYNLPYLLSCGSERMHMWTLASVEICSLTGSLSSMMLWTRQPIVPSGLPQNDLSPLRCSWDWSVTLAMYGSTSLRAKLQPSVQIFFPLEISRDVRRAHAIGNTNLASRHSVTLICTRSSVPCLNDQEDNVQAPGSAYRIVIQTSN